MAQVNALVAPSKGSVDTVLNWLKYVLLANHIYLFVFIEKS